MRRIALITPCHNESAFIASTISALAAQSLRPRKWLIVDDASTDNTKSIVESSICKLPFVELLSIKREPGRSFGFKAHAFNHALFRLDLASYDYIGNLDADILLEPEYFAHILERFESSPNLGICGGVIYTKMGDAYFTEDLNPESVAGAVQLFRTACFKEIGGGYLPLKFGGIDAAAEFLARQKGWKVAKSLHDNVFEQRRTGSGEARPLKAKFRLGRRFHSLGYGWFFYAVRCLYRIKDRPIVIASMLCYLGFLDAHFRGEKVLLPPEVVTHLRRNQKAQAIAFLKTTNPGRFFTRLIAR